MFCKGSLFRKGGFPNVEDLSAEKAAPAKGARVPQAHGHIERPQGAFPPQGEGKGSAELLTKTDRPGLPGDRAPRGFGRPARLSIGRGHLRVALLFLPVRERRENGMVWTGM